MATHGTRHGVRCCCHTPSGRVHLDSLSPSEPHLPVAESFPVRYLYRTSSLSSVEARCTRGHGDLAHRSPHQSPQSHLRAIPLLTRVTRAIAPAPIRVTSALSESHQSPSVPISPHQSPSESHQSHQRAIIEPSEPSEPSESHQRAIIEPSESHQRVIRVVDGVLVRLVGFGIGHELVLVLIGV
jgi:hypothetical protein